MLPSARSLPATLVVIVHTARSALTSRSERPFTDIYLSSVRNFMTAFPSIEAAAIIPASIEAEMMNNARFSIIIRVWLMRKLS